MFVPEYKFENFQVTELAVGPIKKGMTVQDVLDLLPEKQINKVLGNGEFLGDEYDDYEIHDEFGKHVLTITPREKDNLKELIVRVAIVDQRFTTTLNVGLDTSYGMIHKMYPNLTVTPDIGSVVISLDDINAWMSIDKKQLPDDWWDEKNKRVNLHKIPLNAKIQSFGVEWR